MIRPEQMQRPDPIDLKLGIKSSLPNAKKALALLILLWESNGQPASLIYGVEDDGKLLPEPEAFEKLHQYLDLQLTLNGLTEDDLYDAYTNNPLLKSQIEALIDHKPVEQCFAKVPSVELPTKLVQIVLKVLRANIVIDIQQQSLCIGNRNMHPGQYLADLLRFDDLMDMFFHNCTEVCI